MRIIKLMLINISFIYNKKMIPITGESAANNGGNNLDNFGSYLFKLIKLIKIK